jgi:DNA-binding response OmpR family regulator
MKRLIVCDDEPHIVEGLAFLLRKPDREILIARNGQDVLDLIAAEIPDLLIIDVMLPGLSGLDVVARLRSEEATRNVPIIILTAKGQAQDAAMAQEVWAATVVAKPFSPQNLRSLVQSHLEEPACPQGEFA